MLFPEFNSAYAVAVARISGQKLISENLTNGVLFSKRRLPVLSYGAIVLLRFVSFFRRSVTCTHAQKGSAVPFPVRLQPLLNHSTMRKVSLWKTISFLTTTCAALVDTTQASSTHSKVAAAWYTGWHADAGFPLSAVPWSKYTHLTYSFA